MELLAWLVCGIIAATLVYQKGHGLSTQVVVFALGLIGILIAFGLPQKRCVQCDATIKPGAKVCGKCGESV